MKTKKILFTILIAFTVIITSNAQSAVYFDRNNGSIGFAYGSSTVSEAKEIAYKQAINHGADYPSHIVSTYQKGYGAIFIGTNRYGKRVIGAAVGYETLEQAKYYARHAISYNNPLPNTVRLLEYWEDFDHN